MKRNWRISDDDDEPPKQMPKRDGKKRREAETDSDSDRDEDKQELGGNFDPDLESDSSDPDSNLWQEFLNPDCGSRSESESELSSDWEFESESDPEADCSDSDLDTIDTAKKRSKGKQPIGC